MFTATVCVLGLATTLQAAQPKLDASTRDWIAANVCAAAMDRNVDVRHLVAYMLNENRALDLYAIRPASAGNDHGLFQINSFFQAHRNELQRAHHPYYGATIAADLLVENVKKFGWSWQAFAAYWSPEQARRGTAEAKAYYARFARHYQEVDRHLQRAANWIAAANNLQKVGDATTKSALFVSHANNKRVVGPEMTTSSQR
jgi:hypothetical protein